jgi:predicted AAA+ superfamily ATPase
MKSILETCTPRPDILRGTFNPEVFTASLGQVMAHYRGSGGTLDTIYTDAEPFFRDATYPTDGMRTVVSEVLARLAGDGSVPAVHRLETAFGGGKTHTLIALLHLALKGRDIAPLVGDLLVPGVFDAARLHAPGEITVVGVAGD